MQNDMIEKSKTIIFGWIITYKKLKSNIGRAINSTLQSNEDWILGDSQ